MGRRPITNELYNKLLAVFRQYPAEFSRAARDAGCTPRTAKRAWAEGWVRQNKSWAPMQQVIENEQIAARSIMPNQDAAARDRIASQNATLAEAQRTVESTEMRAEREKAAKDAIEARGQEAQMVRILRSDVTGALASVARLLPGMQKWAIAAAAMMDARAPKDIREVTKMMEALSRVTERTAAAADRAMAIERRLLGQPEQIVGLALPEVSINEAIEHIDASQRTLQYARDAGMLPPAEHPQPVIDAELVEADAEQSATG